MPLHCAKCLSTLLLVVCCLQVATSLTLISPQNLTGHYPSKFNWFGPRVPKDIPMIAEVLIADPPFACDFGLLNNAAAMAGKVCWVFDGGHHLSMDCEARYKVHRCEASGAVAVLITRDPRSVQAAGLDQQPLSFQDMTNNVGIPSFGIRTTDAWEIYTNRSDNEPLIIRVDYEEDGGADDLDEQAFYHRCWNAFIYFQGFSLLACAALAFFDLSVRWKTKKIQSRSAQASLFAGGMYGVIRGVAFLVAFDDYNCHWGEKTEFVVASLCYLLAATAYTLLLYTWFGTYYNSGVTAGLTHTTVRRFKYFLSGAMTILYGFYLVWVITVLSTSTVSEFRDVEDTGILVLYGYLGAASLATFAMGFKVTAQIYLFIQSSGSLRSAIENGKTFLMLKISITLALYTIITIAMSLFAVLFMVDIPIRPNTPGGAIMGDWYYSQWAQKTCEVLVLLVLSISFFPTGRFTRDTRGSKPSATASAGSRSRSESQQSRLSGSSSASRSGSDSGSMDDSASASASVSVAV